MFFSAMYYSMLITNWGNISVNNSNNDYFSTSSVMAFSVKIGSALFSTLLYSWSLVAPLVCTGRDFSR